MVARGCEGPLDADPLALKSTDGETFRIRYGVTKQSMTLVDVVEAHGGALNLCQPLEVQLDAEMLRAVIKWCGLHRGKDTSLFAVLQPNGT